MDKKYVLRRNGKTYMLSNPKIKMYGTAKNSFKQFLLTKISSKDDEIFKPFYKSLHKDLLELRRKIEGESPKILYLQEKVELLENNKYTQYRKRVHEIKNAIHKKKVEELDFSEEMKELEEIEKNEPKEERDNYIQLSKNVDELRKLRPYEITNELISVVTEHYDLSKAERTDIAKKFCTDYESFKKFYHYTSSQVIEFVFNNENLFFALLEQCFHIEPTKIEDF